MSAASSAEKQPKKGPALPNSLNKTWEERNKPREGDHGDDMSSTWDGASTQWDQQSDAQSDAQSGTWDVEQMEKRKEGNPQWNNESSGKKIGRIQDIKIDRLDKNSDTAELSDGEMDDERKNGGSWPFPSPCVMFGKTDKSKEDAVFSQFKDLSFNASSWEAVGFSDSEGEGPAPETTDVAATTTTTTTSKDNRRIRSRTMKQRKFNRSESMDPNYDDDDDSDLDASDALVPGQTPQKDVAMKYSMVTPSLGKAQEQIKRPPTLKKGMRALPKPKAVSTPSAVKGLNWNHAFSPGDLDAADAADLLDEGDADLDNDDLLAQPMDQGENSNQSAPPPRGVKQNSEDTWRHKQLGDFRKRNKSKMMQSAPNLSDDEQRAQQDDRDLLPKEARSTSEKGKLPLRSKSFAAGNVGMVQSAHASMMTARKSLNRRKKEPLSGDSKMKRSKSVTSRMTKKRIEAPTTTTDEQVAVAAGAVDTAVKREVPRSKSLVTGMNAASKKPNDNQKLLSAVKILGSGKAGTTDPQEEADLLIQRPSKPKRSTSAGTKEDAREKAKRRSQLHRNRSFRQEKDSQQHAAEQREKRSDKAPMMRAKSERTRRSNGSSGDPLSLSSRSNRSSHHRRSSSRARTNDGSEHGGGVRRTKSFRSDLKEHHNSEETSILQVPERTKITTADLMKASKKGLEALEIRHPPSSEEEYKKALARRSSRRKQKDDDERSRRSDDRPRMVGRTASFRKRQENARDIRDLLKEGKKVTETDLLDKSNRRMLHSMIFEQKMGVNMTKLFKQINKKPGDA